MNRDDEKEYDGVLYLRHYEENHYDIVQIIPQERQSYFITPTIRAPDKLNALLLAYDRFPKATVIPI